MDTHVLLAYFSFSSRSRREHYKIYFKFTKQYHVYRISTGNLLYRGIYVFALPLATSCQLLRLDEIPWRLITVHGCSIETLVDNRISISNKSADKRNVVAIRRSSSAANEILDVCTNWFLLQCRRRCVMSGTRRKSDLQSTLFDARHCA